MLPLASRPGGGPGGDGSRRRPEPEAVPGQDEQEPEQPEPAPRPEPGVVPPGFAGTARAAEGSGVFSRYAGAMLLHAYPGRAGEILPEAAGGDAREAALLSAVSSCFALGAATAEQFKHLAPAEAGPLAGLAALPSLRTLRPAAGRDRRRRRPAAAAGGIRAGDAGGEPGDLRGVLRR